MDRAYLADHKVHVYPSTPAQHAGHKPRVVHTKPWPHQGYDNYQVDGVMYPGLIDSGTDADACVFLDKPLLKHGASHGATQP